MNNPVNCWKAKSLMNAHADQQPSSEMSGFNDYLAREYTASAVEMPGFHNGTRYSLDFMGNHKQLDKSGARVAILREETEDTVAEAIAVPEEVRAKIPTDFGRSKGIAWCEN